MLVGQRVMTGANSYCPCNKEHCLAEALSLCHARDHWKEVFMSIELRWRASRIAGNTEGRFVSGSSSRVEMEGGVFAMKPILRQINVKCAMLTLTLVLCLLAAPGPAAAHIDAVEVIPSNPTVYDPVTIQASGYLPDGCWDPGPWQCGAVVGFSITPTIHGSDAWQPGGYCPLVIMPYSFACEYGTLDPGHYVVTVTETHESLRDPDTDIFVVEFDVMIPAAVRATVDLDPNTLNLKGRGKYVACYVELPEGFDPTDIDVSTVMLNAAIPAELSPTSVGDYDGDGIPDRMMKFSREDLIDLVGDDRGDGFEVTVSGELMDGTEFSGTDVIRVINPGSAGSTGGGTVPVKVYPTAVGGTPRISYELAAEGPVNLLIFDASGRLVRTLEAGNRAAGTHTVTWDRRTDDGLEVRSGIYFIRLEQRGQASVQKLLILE
jgi:hypothetical protein